jgi:nucleoside 2-deoxyribosyltransferase
MKSIALCGSRRYKPEARTLAKKLTAKGIVVYEPIMNTNPRINDLEKDLKRYAFIGLTLHHFEQIRKADVVYIYNKDGYMGNSTTLELGAAVALGKPIYTLEHEKDEPCREALIDEVIPSFKELLKRLV